MSIFNFTDEQSLSEVRSVETSRITGSDDYQRLQKARVGRLVAIQSMGDGMADRHHRTSLAASGGAADAPEVDPPADLAGVPQEENGVQLGRHLSCSGWAAQGTPSRAVFILPEINRPVFPH
jgi:hypothetical protein